MTISQDTVVLYHRGCNDGIAAAWAAHEVLGDSAIYLPYQYNDPLPDACKGRHVILVDLSFTMAQIHDHAYSGEVLSLMIIDHHKSAIKQLQNIPNVSNYSDYLNFRDHSVEYKVWIFADTQHSGAVLSWAFFNNKPANEGFAWNKDIPLILQYIEDYDLWKKKMDNTMAINAWLVNGELSIERFASMLRTDGTPRLNIVETGNALLTYDAKIERHVLREYVQFVEYNGQKVPLVNAPHHLRNSLGEKLGRKYPFVILYTERDGKTIYSLRSVKGQGEDVSVIAEQFGGGGHAEAAAFSIPHTPLDLYKHQALLKKPSFLERLKAAWVVLKG